MENAFKAIDKNRDGVIERSELLHALHSQGQRNVTEDDINELMKSMDLNKDGEIQFSEYAQVLRGMYKNEQNQLDANTDKKGVKKFKVRNSTSGFSTFSEEERSAYVKVINTVLKDDADCKKYLPIDPNGMEIFNFMQDGIILCKLINCAVKGTIEEKVINKKQNMNIYLMTVIKINYL
jgi:plastin-1